MDPAQMIRVYGDLRNKVNCKAQYASSKYNVQIQPLCFEWDKFTPKLERQFLDAPNEMLNCNCQWHSQIKMKVGLQYQGMANQIITLEGD